MLFVSSDFRFPLHKPSLGLISFGAGLNFENVKFMEQAGRERERERENQRHRCSHIGLAFVFSFAFTTTTPTTARIFCKGK